MTLIQIPNRQNQLVATITLPEDWIAGKKPARPAYLQMQKFFVSPRDERAGICLRSPGKKTYDYLSSQENPFLELLRKPPHPLSEQEFLGIQLLLEQASWPGRFSREQAKTTFFNPRNVLELQGLWIKENMMSRALILDTTYDTGNYVQEVWFISPPEKFHDFVWEIDQIFSSLTWYTAAQ